MILKFETIGSMHVLWPDLSPDTGTRRPLTCGSFASGASYSVSRQKDGDFRLVLASRNHNWPDNLSLSFHEQANNVHRPDVNVGLTALDLDHCAQQVSGGAVSLQWNGHLNPFVLGVDEKPS